MTCEKCDEARKRDGTPWKIGEPCDVCDGRGVDYLGRDCRHCGPHLSDGQEASDD